MYRCTYSLSSAIAILALSVCTNVYAESSKRRFDDSTIDKLAARADENTAKRAASGTHPRHDAVVAIINQRGFACSGVLIHPRAVLTARHCQSGLRVVFGNDAHELRLVIPVAEVRAVPNRAIDLALMILTDAAPVKPYPLHATDTPPKTVQVIGFGCHPPDDCRPSGRRSYFDARLPMGRWGCDRTAASQLGCLSGHEMVLPRTVGSDTCTGDSGGAVLQANPPTSTDRNRDSRADSPPWTLVAITSRGIRDSVLRCGDGGIYVRVAPQRSWIMEQLKDL